MTETLRNLYGKKSFIHSVNILGPELLQPCEEIGSSCLQGTTTSTIPEKTNLEPPSLKAQPQLQETEAGELGQLTTLFYEVPLNRDLGGPLVEDKHKRHRLMSHLVEINESLNLENQVPLQTLSQ